MVLHIVSTIVSEIVPSDYYFSAAVTIFLLVIIRAYSQGRRTNRDRDLHARTVILTGAFTPLGLTVLEFLAKKGAHVIALVPSPSLTSHHAEILSLLRSTTSNESIYAEPCPLSSPSAIKNFCQRFVNTEKEKERRVDALILTHEYGHIGTWSTTSGDLVNEQSIQRDEGAMATFLLITLLLPALLVAPIDRDIRIISLVNPFYAAAAPAFNPRLSSTVYNPGFQRNPGSSEPNATPAVRSSSSWIFEGQRALRTACFMRHFQRILDALPQPGTDHATSSTNSPPESESNKLRAQQSNILAVTVSPGISRKDTIAPCLVSPHEHSATRQWVGSILYIMFLPFLHLFTKSPTSALQSVVHVLCIPRPHRRQYIPSPEDVAQPPPESQQLPSQEDSTRRTPPGAEEVLVPGALYSDCSVVKAGLRLCNSVPMDHEVQVQEDASQQFEFGLGDERIGQAVWEALEAGVKVWEEREKEGKARTF